MKILARHSPSYGNLINYLIKERENEKPIVFTYNLRTNDPTLAIREFMENESFRKNPRSDQVFLYHEIIGFSDKDAQNITPEILISIGKEYIKLRGNTGLYYGAIHLDRESPHLHFLTSATQLYTGKAMRLSKNSLSEIKNQLQEYHLKNFPEISNSKCQHNQGKRYIKNKEWHKNKRNTMKTEIIKTVELCLKQAKTQKEFLELLQQNNLHHYERKHGEVTGIVYENDKYRFTRLGIDIEKLQSLPLDLTEEQKTLKEIETIRNKREEPIKDRMLRFEENGQIKTVTYNQDLKETAWEGLGGNLDHLEEELNPEEKDELDRLWELAELNGNPPPFDSNEPEIDLTEFDPNDIEPEDYNPEDYNLDDLLEFEEPER